jgi:DNA-binding transcriptional ArsR family regulator
MGKTLETKKRILSLLRKREMTMTELSDELDLSNATVSQHLSELQSAGAVEKLENEHFRKLKYYRAKGEVASDIAKYAAAIGAIVIIASAIYLYSGVFSTGVATNAAPLQSNPVKSMGNVSVINPNTVTSCPMMFYGISGNVVAISGLTEYTGKSNYGQVSDFVLGSGTSGVLFINETIGSVLNEPSGFSTVRSHYAHLSNAVPGIGTPVSGISISISPKNYTVLENETLSIATTISANSTASGTYWLRIDGPCGGGVAPVLITVGSGPYGGNATTPVSPYA